MGRLKGQNRLVNNKELCYRLEHKILESLKCQGKEFILYTVRKKVLVKEFELLSDIVKVVLTEDWSGGGLTEYTVDSMADQRQGK